MANPGSPDPTGHDLPTPGEPPGGPMPGDLPNPGEQPGEPAPDDVPSAPPMLGGEPDVGDPMPPAPGPDIPPGPSGNPGVVM